MSSHTAPRNKVGHGVYVKKSTSKKPTKWGFKDDPMPEKTKRPSVKENTQLSEEEYDRLRDRWREQGGGYDGKSFASTYRGRASAASSSHAVHINGKKWKSFGSKAHATAVANKIASKNAGKKVAVHKEEYVQESSHEEKPFKIVRKERHSLKPEHQAHKDKVSKTWADRRKRWDEYKNSKMKKEGFSAPSAEERAERKVRAALYAKKDGFKHLGKVKEIVKKMRKEEVNANSRLYGPEKLSAADTLAKHGPKGGVTVTKKTKFGTLRITKPTEKMKEAVVYPKGPKQPMSPELAAQVAKDMAKRKAAHHKMLKGVKKEIDAQTKGKKPVVIHDPMDESMMAEGNLVNKAARNNHDIATGKSAMQTTHTKAQANSGLLSAVPDIKRAGRSASKAMGSGPGLSKKFVRKNFYSTAAGRSKLLKHDGMAPAKKNESVDINELKASTLKSYVKKSDKDFNKRMKTVASGRVYMTNKMIGRIGARQKGIAVAQHKLRSGDVTKEEVSLSELKKATYGKYIRAAINNRDELNDTGSAMSYSAQHPAKSKYRTTDHAKQADLKPLAKNWRVASAVVGKRNRGINAALSKLTKESTEITELKRSTPASYVKSASKSLAKASKDAGMRVAGGSGVYYQRPWPSTKTIRKRTKGIDAATSKLAQESAEIAELKDATLGSYIEKATASHKKLGAAQEKGNMKGQKSNMPKLYNRARGIRRAHVKVVNGDYKGMAAHESVNLDELKSGTLQSYKAKAGNQIDKLAKQAKSGRGTPETTKKFAKRSKGIVDAGTNLSTGRVSNPGPQPERRKNYSFMYKGTGIKPPTPVRRNRVREETIIEAVSKSAAKKVYDDMQCACDFDQFYKGMNVELEHKDVTHGDLHTTAKIAIAHLKEDPKYYDKLSKIEKR